MTTIVLVLTALAVALTLGLLAHEDPGYVLISRWPYEIEVSLALFLAGLAVGLVAVYFLIRMLFRIFRAPAIFTSGKHADGTPMIATLTGYARLIEGEWEEAEIALNEGLGRGSTVLQYLGAAYAAQQQGILRPGTGTWSPLVRRIRTILKPLKLPEPGCLSGLGRLMRREACSNSFMSRACATGQYKECYWV